MTREETVKILTIIQAAYPNYKPQDKTLTVNTWNEMLEDYTYQQVSIALKAYITTDTSGFAPSIGQIIGKIRSLTAQPGMSEMEAWHIVKRAIGDSLYNAEERYNELPEVLKKLVGSPNQLRQWAYMPSDEINTVVQSNFMRSYSVVSKRVEEMNKLPKGIREMISSLSENISMIEDGSGSYYEK